MTDLMVYGGASEPDAAATRTGGVPLVPAGFRWPRCRECRGNLQFIAQVVGSELARVSGDAGDAVVAVFVCQNDPDMCDDWDATGGANQALVLPGNGLVPAPEPAEGETSLGEVSAITIVTSTDDYEEARGRWSAETGRSGAEVLGQLGGTPAWLQEDETPACPGCARPMAFTAQFEEGHEFRTAINFGGGVGYLFACWDCRRAAFLWQR